MKTPPNRPLVVGIDASRNRSGGAKAHLVGILNAVDPRDHGIDHVHVWTYRRLAELLPDRPWLTKQSPAELEASLGRQLLWQRFSFPGELERAGCRVLLTTDAGSIGTFSPAVVMSRDMLSFEPREMARFRFRLAWLRLAALRVVQVRSLRAAAGALFLTQYAARVCQECTGKLDRVRVIPHGIADEFRLSGPSVGRAERGRATCRCLYVSNLDLYKHQWHVVAAMGELWRAGYDVTLTLVGGGGGEPRRMLDAELAKLGEWRSRIEVIEAVPHHEIPRYLASADLFIFASSCENMPNTLVEAMAAGLPIACSNRGPMPEVLKDGGLYFDPENPASIALSVRQFLDDDRQRVDLANKARQLALQYSWARCARETWQFLRDTAQEG